MKQSTWLLRRILKRSPVGEPAALTAAAYVALRAVALRAEHPRAREAWRPQGPVTAPAGWLPDPRPLASDLLAPLRARGVVALVARAPDQHLAGIAAAVGLNAPAVAVDARLRDPRSWLGFPGLAKVRVHPGPNGPGADVEDNLPLVDCDASWTAQPGPTPRWIATAGATRGAHLGWERLFRRSDDRRPQSLSARRSDRVDRPPFHRRRAAARRRVVAGPGLRRRRRRQSEPTHPVGTPSGHVPLGYSRGISRCSVATPRRRAPCIAESRRDNGHEPCCSGVTCDISSGWPDVSSCSLARSTMTT